MTIETIEAFVERVQNWPTITIFYEQGGEQKATLESNCKYVAGILRGSLTVNGQEIVMDSGNEEVLKHVGTTAHRLMITSLPELIETWRTAIVKIEASRDLYSLEYLMFRATLAREKAGYDKVWRFEEIVTPYPRPDLDHARMNHLYPRGQRPIGKGRPTN